MPKIRRITASIELSAYRRTRLALKVAQAFPDVVIVPEKLIAKAI